MDTRQRPSPADLHAKAWVDIWELLDLQLSPLGLRAMDALAPSPGEIILDIGCGAGQTVLQLAGRVGAQGQVIGVDIALSLLAVAARRARDLPQVRFVEDDAQTLDLPTQCADAIYSRFGVMAFKDPLAAFVNFRRMLKPSGRLAFVCWRSLEDNELDHAPLRAAALEALVDLQPFSLCDPTFLRSLLEGAGFRQIVLQPLDLPVSSGGVHEMSAVLLRVGGLGKLVRENPALRAEAEPAVRRMLEARLQGGQAPLRAATWIVTAGL